MALYKFNFGADTDTTLFHNSDASGRDFNMYSTCHSAGEAVFGNIRVTGTSVFSCVGIGTSSPSEQLHLLAPTGGSSSLRIDSCADGAELQLNDIAGTVTGMWTLKNRNGW